MKKDEIKLLLIKEYIKGRKDERKGFKENLLDIISWCDNSSNSETQAIVRDLKKLIK